MINMFNNSNCSPDFILLQEIWQPHCPTLFPLCNYNQPDFKLRSHNVQGGGVGVYIKKGLRYNVLHDKSIFIDRVLESIFVEVWTTPHKKIIVGSVYRPNVNHPTLSSSQQFDQFFELFTNLMDDLTNLNVPIFLFGDFNLDLLRYNIVKQVTEYADLLFSYGCIQVVMKPTRCTPSSATLLDHLITNHHANTFETVILTSKISDHYPFIYI
jgi:exonuclease III